MKQGIYFDKNCRKKSTDERISITGGEAKESWELLRHSNMHGSEFSKKQSFFIVICS
jgi:hypothetical protein